MLETLMDARFAALLLCTAAALACGGEDKPLTGPSDDTTPPLVRIVFPIAPDSILPEGDYDETGDGLLDLRVEWSDLQSGVNPVTARMVVLEGKTGSSVRDDGLLALWDVARLDQTDLEAHETVGGLMGAEWSRLVVSVADSAGNVGTDTLVVHLPHGALHHTIEMNRPQDFATGIAVCADDDRVYMTTGNATAIGKTVVVVDAQTFAVVGTVTAYEDGDLAGPVCIEGTPDLYVAATPRVWRFDRARIEWAGPVPGSLTTNSLVRSLAAPNLLYAGEEGTGSIGLIDLSLGERTGMLDLQISPFQEYVFDMEVLDGDSKLYTTLSTRGGIRVIDPATSTELGEVNVDPGGGWGRTDDMVRSPDGSRIYAAVMVGPTPGLAEVDTRTDQTVRLLEVPASWVPVAVALNASGTRLFLTTRSETSNQPQPAENLLIDVEHWRTLETFPRPHPPEPGMFRLDQAVAFHPSGRLAYLTRDSDIDVYVIRE